MNISQHQNRENYICYSLLVLHVEDYNRSSIRPLLFCGEKLKKIGQHLKKIQFSARNMCPDLFPMSFAIPDLKNAIYGAKCAAGLTSYVFGVIRLDKNAISAKCVAVLFF